MIGLRSQAFLIGVCLITSARAEVMDSTSVGFTVKEVVTVSSTPELTYQSVVRDIGQWWDPAHTYSGSASNLSIDATPGGCFCEKLPGGGVRHMVVVFAESGKTLRLSGGLGPLQAMAVSGSMTWKFTSAGTGTKLEVIYAVGGYSPKGFQSLAPIVDQVLGSQLKRLKNFIEKGKPGGD